jgi:serine/threonine protein kinase
MTPSQHEDQNQTTGDIIIGAKESSTSSSSPSSETTTTTTTTKNQFLEVAVVTELCPRGDLMSALKSAPNQRLPENQVKKIAKGLVSGLEFLHSKGVVHRDLKLQVRIFITHNSSRSKTF